MIEIFIFLIWLAAVVAPTIKYVFKRGNARLKLALGVCYILFTAEVWNLYNNAEAAEEYKIPAGGTGWFGHWWPIVLLALFIMITMLHFRLRAAGKKLERNASPERV